MQRRKLYVGLAAALATTASTVAVTAQGTANATGDGYGGGYHDVAKGYFVALNSSGVTGVAKVIVKGKHAKVQYVARGVSPDLPHAAHLHYSPDAQNTCPTILADENDDFRVSTPEGVPFYGGIQKSLTVRGDAMPASALELDRFPTPDGTTIYYSRWIRINLVQREAIKQNEMALVVHGIDYNANGEYDFESAGPSPLDENVPAEATNPAACTILR